MHDDESHLIILKNKPIEMGDIVVGRKIVEKKHDLFMVVNNMDTPEWEEILEKIVSRGIVVAVNSMTTA